MDYLNGEDAARNQAELEADTPTCVAARPPTGTVAIGLHIPLFTTNICLCHLLATSGPVADVLQMKWNSKPGFLTGSLAFTIVSCPEALE